VEQLVAPTYAVAETAIRRGGDDETERGLLLLHALHWPAQRPSIRAFPDDEIIDLAARAAVVMARPTSDFPSSWSGPTAYRPLGVVARLRIEDERRRIRTGAKTLGATSDTTYRRWLAEAIRRDFFDAESHSLTEKGLAALEDKAERDKAAREAK
jgi:hypothetical protein